MVLTLILFEIQSSSGMSEICKLSLSKWQLYEKWRTVWLKLLYTDDPLNKRSCQGLTYWDVVVRFPQCFEIWQISMSFDKIYFILLFCWQRQQAFIQIRLWLKNLKCLKKYGPWHQGAEGYTLTFWENSVTLHFDLLI